MENERVEKKVEGNEVDLLRRALLERTKKQVADCIMELNGTINEVLNKHQCVLDVSVTVRQGSITPNVGVLPRANK